MKNSVLNIRTLLQAIEGGQPKLQCSSKTTVSHLCLSSSCKASAGSCSNDQCPSCTTRHRFCECLKVSSLTTLLQELTSKQRIFTDQLNTITEKLIQKLMKKMKEYQDEICFSYLSAEDIETISGIYIRESGLKVKGESVEQLFRKLKQVRSQTQNLKFDFKIEFEREAEDILDSLDVLQKRSVDEFREKFRLKLSHLPPKIDPRILDEYEQLRKKCVHLSFENKNSQSKISQIKEEKLKLSEDLSALKNLNVQIKELMKEERKQKEQMFEEVAILKEKLALCETKLQLISNSETKISMQNLEFQSKIITREQVEEIEFISQSFQKKVSKMDLIFRASEHEFLAQEFHKHCDGVNDTFTLIRTDFGKTMAGYTPSAWESPNNEDTKIIADLSLKSFLLSFDHREKMSLSDKNYAIYFNKERGPIFGNCDILIKDKCNTSDNSTFFAWSYNCQDKYKKNHRDSWKALTGSANQTFKVLEYEVFKLKFMDEKDEIPCKSSK